MFGYVKPCKPELRVRELETYKAVYCGLCAKLGKAFGPLSRLTLSYDFTFLSMLYLDVSGLPFEVTKRRCFINPFKKSLCLKETEALSFGADIAAITLYYKLLDNIADSPFWSKAGWYALLPLASPAWKKASARMPEAQELVKQSTISQAGLEARLSDSLDEACEPTAAAMSGICGLIAGDEKTRRVLERFGYFLGRYVYIRDAADDLEEDIKKGRYNPLAQRFGLESDKSRMDEALEYAKCSLYMTIGEAEKAYALLPRGDLAPVLENIITLGLRSDFDISIQRPKA